MSDTTPSAASPPAARPPSLTRVFLTFLTIGATSIGGGVVAYLRSHLVGKHGWFDDATFLEMLSISQTMPGLNATNMSVLAGDRLREVRRHVPVDLGPDALERAVGQVEVVVERDPAGQYGRVHRAPAQVGIPGGGGVGPVHQGERGDVIVPHGPRQPPGQLKARDRLVGRQRRAQERFKVRAVRALPEPLRLGPDRELAGVEPEVEREPEAEPAGELR